MKSGPILYLEESRPPRVLTWTLVVLAACTIATADGNWSAPQPTIFTLYVIAGALCTLLLLEFVAISITVTPAEVRFSFSPVHRRRFAIADIRQWEVRTYSGSNFAGTYYRRIYSWRPPKHAVEFTMKDGSQVVLLSQHAEHLAHAIGRAKEIISQNLPASVSS